MMVSSRVNRKCFAPGCTTGYATNKIKFSLFKARTEADRSKWCKIIPRKDRSFSERDVLCAKHFDNSDIIKVITINGISIPYKCPRLKAGALPKYFSIYPKKSSAKQNRNRRQQFCDEKNINCDILSTCVEEDLDQILSTSGVVEQSLFLKLFYKVIRVTSDTWEVHASFDNCRTLLFSQMAVVNNVPVMKKQVILNEHNEIHYYIGKNKVTLKNLPNVLVSLDHLNDALNQFDLMNICFGGPPSNLFNDMITVTKCAHIEYISGIWRHNKCNFINDTLLNQCSFCSGLWKTFQIKTEDSNL